MMKPPTFNDHRRSQVRQFKHCLYPPLVVLAILAIQSNGLSQETIPPPATDRSPDCPILYDPPISDISTDITPPNDGKFPTDCSRLLGDGVVYSAVELLPTGTIGSPFHYGAHFFHRPLYFEDPALERYGCSHGHLQPVVSGVKFYGSALLLPLKMLRLPPHACVSTPPCM